MFKWLYLKKLPNLALVKIIERHHFRNVIMVQVIDSKHKDHQKVYEKTVTSTYMNCMEFMTDLDKWKSI